MISFQSLFLFKSMNLLCSWLTVSCLISLISNIYRCRYKKNQMLIRLPWAPNQVRGLRSGIHRPCSQAYRNAQNNLILYFRQMFYSIQIVLNSTPFRHFEYSRFWNLKMWQQHFSILWTKSDNENCVFAKLDNISFNLWNFPVFPFKLSDES